MRFHSCYVVIISTTVLIFLLATSKAFTVPSLAQQNSMYKSLNPKLSSIAALPLRSSNNSPEPEKKQSQLPMLLDPGTRGGALFLSLVLFVVPILVYQLVTVVFGVDGIDAGKWIGVGFTFFTTVLWVCTYIFRVATKDMTYAKQLKDYENAVIAKRLEELDEDEIQALVEDIERDEF
mmetsp:Transcript_41201/g.46820  ORF Transcript_41201/g.46820 Transcript_41201/m.46820 type:complete len:178 (+) Transcript_41201:203-736(+)